ncbi:hypothetical protein HRbin16_01218 [bacterium HR16]|nr:hypothetical protein HRbin16_01218 [bacterium HR16]
MPRLLTDENIFPALVRNLRSRGYDVKDIRESGLSGASDEAIMRLALREERTLITFDKHFADILRYPPSSHYGVVLIRVHPPVAEDVWYALENFCDKFDMSSLRGALVVVERTGFRVRRTP